MKLKALLSLFLRIHCHVFYATMGLIYFPPKADRAFLPFFPPASGLESLQLGKAIGPPAGA